MIINGAKKRDYVVSWLDLAGCRDTPTAVVNMPVASQQATSRRVGGPLHAVISGYVQPWSHPGEWSEAVVPFIDDGSLVLHLLVGNRWGRRSARRALPPTFQLLASMPGVRSHGVMEYGDFRRFLSRCHLSIDLFSRNPERELAFVTRTSVSLACGLPAIHVPFTEVSELIRRFEAGWLVESTDLDGLTAALTEATHDPAVLAAKARRSQCRRGRARSSAGHGAAARAARSTPLTPSGSTIHVLTPFYKANGGVVKIMDYVTHALAGGYRVSVWCPDEFNPTVPLFGIDRFSDLSEDPDVRFHSDHAAGVPPERSGLGVLADEL